VKRLIQSIHEQTDHRMCLLEAKDLVDNLNRRLRAGPTTSSWSGQPAVPVGGSVHQGSVARWLRYKHKIRGGGYSQFPDDYLYQRLGLIRLPEFTRNLPWAKA